MNTKKHKHKNRPKAGTGSTGSADVKEERSEVFEKTDESEKPLQVDRPEERKLVEEVKVEEIITIDKSLKDKVVEVKEITEQTEPTEPPKPKRNKNKKKNQEPEKDLQEIIDPEKQKTIPEQVLSDSSKIEQPISIIEDKETLEDTAITPSARKKKNKKKTQEKTAINPEEIKPAAEIKPKDVSLPDTIELLDAQVTELFSAPSEPSQEGKGKKKNKKKKRTDSERSDKSEGKCTAAFENLLVEETKTQEAEVKDDKITETTTEVTPIVKQEIIKETIFEVSHESPKEQCKNKKKNKKDKKHAPAETTLEQTESIPELISITTETPQETPVTFETKIEKEASPKPKAKIAKPVEKKSKANTEVSKPADKKSTSTENLNITPETITSSLTLPKEDIKKDESKSIIESELKETTTSDEATKCSSQDAHLSIPEASSMGKKRKKSPKLPKSEPPKVTENIPLSKPEIIQSKPEDDCIKDKGSKLTNEPEIISTEQKEESKIESDDKVTKTEINILSDIIVPAEIPKTEEKSAEGKSGKKKKKTPKVPTQSEIQKEKIEISVDVPDINKDQAHATPSKINESKGLAKKNEKDKAIEAKPVSLEDIEIRSTRTESEGSTCDVMPDVHFIRSSSHQLFDNNNNTTSIQEVISQEDVKFTDTLPVPIIEGSGETPITTPEVTGSTQFSKADEKTQGKDDTIKSKMMEVNKDMEELRMSIERSLAEFSAMEKTEEESEKLIENKGKIEAEVAGITKQEKVQIEKQSDVVKDETVSKEINIHDIPSETQESKCSDIPPCPARKDKKGKGKKGKGTTDTSLAASSSTQSSLTTTTESSSTTTTTDKTKDDKKEKQEKDDKKSQSQGKQQSDSTGSDHATESKEAAEETNLASESKFSDSLEQLDYDRIENFEDALTSSNDDVNKTFEMIAQEAETENQNIQKELNANKPAINVTDTEEDEKTKRNEKVKPISPPKNLLGPNDIPVPSNKTDYKKERNKPPNEKQAKVKIKDATDIEKKSKECQTNSRIKNLEKSIKDTFSHVVKDSDEYVYKYSFRKVYLQNACHVCKKDLGQVRVPCGYCNLVFYCGTKHKDEDYSQHQSLCFAVSTIVHLKDQKHVYADAKGITGQDYRILRMQMILSCEKVLKRRLVPWEQEAMLYPRICADVTCREWRQTKLKDCEGCGQLSYCTNDPSHLPKTHQRWCKSYSLYAKLVTYQQTKGRLEPRLPTKVLQHYEVPAKMNEVLAAMYEEKIDMNDIQYASLTQLATAPLTAAYYHQQYRHKNNKMHFSNGTSYKKPFVIHVVGAELQFEADALNKWEVFFLHLRPDVQDMTVVLISPALNPGNLPLDLLGKVRVCSDCKENKRRVNFSFQDLPYYEYRTSEVFMNPDLICAFNPSIQRSSAFNMKDVWSSTVNSILKLATPFIITAYTLPELRKDIAKIKELSDIDFSIVAEPILNNFASVRPDRNFITDDELPLLFKNYCVSVICGC